MTSVVSSAINECCKDKAQSNTIEKMKLFEIENWTL